MACPSPLVGSPDIRTGLSPPSLAWLEYSEACPERWGARGYDLRFCCRTASSCCWVGASCCRRCATSAPSGAQRSVTGRPRVGGGLRRVGYRLTLVGVLVAMAVQIPLGFHNALNDARAFHAEQEKAADGLQHIDHITNVEHGQSEFFLAPSLIRQQARILREHRLSLYADR